MVLCLSDSGFARAVGAAIESVLGLDPVPDDPAPALSADRGQLLDRAFEAVEDMLPARRDHLEGQIIIVAANFTLGHAHTSFEKQTEFTGFFRIQLNSQNPEKSCKSCLFSLFLCVAQCDLNDSSENVGRTASSPRLHQLVGCEVMGKAIILVSLLDRPH